MAIRTSPPPRPAANPSSPEDHQRFVDLMEAHTFHFAKTMADIPHSYTREREWTAQGDREDFVWACQHILDHGYQQRFYSVFFTYYDMDVEADGETVPHQHWIMAADGMTNDPTKVVVINRAEKKG